MEPAIFIFFLALFLYAVVKLPFFKNSGLSGLQLTTLFILKILAGICYGLFYKLPQYYKGADTWRFYRLSLKERDWLIADPAAFLKDLFVHGYDKAGNLFAGENSYWNDLKSNVPVKMMACMNVITNSSYYTNIIIFNFIFLFGLVAIFKMFNQIYPGKKWFLMIGIFLLPSTIFWCSGIHKDGLILSALGLLAFNFYKLLKDEKLNFKRIAIVVLCIVFIFPLRNYVSLALIPALLCWAISHKLKRKPVLLFPAVYIIGIALFFSAPYIHSSLNFPGFIVEKQLEFRQLDGNSEIFAGSLEPTFISFIKFFPSAVDMAVLRPHITEIKNFSYIPAIFEIALIMLLAFLCFFYKDRSTKTDTPTIFFCIFFGASLLIIAGYTITFSGAIVRYRSLVLPFLLTPLLCMVEWKGILNKVLRKKQVQPIDYAKNKLHDDA